MAERSSRETVSAGAKPVVIRPARATEEDVLSALAQRSKAHWGYSAELMERFRSALTVTTEQCRSGRLFVAEVEGSPAGFAAWNPDGDAAELCDLWIDPDWMGVGVGRLLFDRIAATCRAAAFDRLWCEADPHAVGFYERMGGRQTGSVESGSMPGRLLPRMEFDLRSG